MKRYCLAYLMSWAAAIWLVSPTVAAEFGIDAVVALPADAQEVLQGHATQTAEIEARAAAEQRRLTERTIQQLQAVQDNYTRAARLDEALVVRSEIRRLQATLTSTASGTVLSSFPAYPQLRERIGQSFICSLTGNTTGTIWGTDLYTDDSDAATAAVHAGVLAPGESGLVRVTVLGSQSEFAASTRNGVISNSWGVWDCSFRLARASGARLELPRPEPVAVKPDPGNLSSLSAQPGQVCYFQVTGSIEGYVYGNNIYTADSTIATAAVHCGVLTNGQAGVVKVTVMEGQSSYDGVTRNGVRSSSWGSYHLSYRVEATNFGGSSAAAPLPDPGYLYSYSDKIGQSFLFQVTGSVSGSIWGSDIYTSDSTLATACVHAGVLANGQTGIVKVTMLPGQASYDGTSRNGVTSSSWHNYSASYRLEPCSK